jgi:CRP-like cAMP-binding protein
MDIQSFLARQFLFESLSEDQMELIAGSASIKKVKKTELLFSEAQPATAFFIVVSGKVKIYKLSSDGSEQILHIQEPGDLVAEAIIFDFDTYPAFCEALEDTVLIRLSKPEFLKLLGHFPDITFKIMSAYSRRLRLLLAKIEELSLHDIKSRLANYLLSNSIIKNKRCIVRLSLTKKDLASMLGTIPETLSRTLNFFKREKLISEEKNQIIIFNKTKLKSFI